MKMKMSVIGMAIVVVALLALATWTEGFNGTMITWPWPNQAHPCANVIFTHGNQRGYTVYPTDYVTLNGQVTCGDSAGKLGLNINTVPGGANLNYVSTAMAPGDPLPGPQVGYTINKANGRWWSFQRVF